MGVYARPPTWFRKDSRMSGAWKVEVGDKPMCEYTRVRRVYVYVYACVCVYARVPTWFRKHPLKSWAWKVEVVDKPMCEHNVHPRASGVCVCVCMCACMRVPRLGLKTTLSRVLL